MKSSKRQLTTTAASLFLFFPLFVPGGHAATSDVSLTSCHLGGCKYAARNIFQLQACELANKLGDLAVENLFLCRSKETRETCEATTTTDLRPCVWLEPPEGFEKVDPSGSCLPFVATGGDDEKEQQMVTMGVKTFLSEVQALGIESLPSTLEQNDCQQHSYDPQTCLRTQDRKGRGCGICRDLNPEYYPFNPPLTSLCIQQQYIDNGICDSFKGPLETCKEWDRKNHPFFNITTSTTTLAVSLPEIVSRTSNHIKKVETSVTAGHPNSFGTLLKILMFYLIFVSF